MGAEQEFGTKKFGIKGFIDATIKILNEEQEEKITALEIKTGKYKSLGYRGQVILYSLLLSERFLNSNPNNFLLFIMDEPTQSQDYFQYIKQKRQELGALIRIRNGLAYYFKQNDSEVSSKITCLGSCCGEPNSNNAYGPKPQTFTVIC